jgi:hypothetical protein
MSKLYGVQQGLIIGQQERVDELNDRIASRQFPDHGLAPNFDPRPVMTKYMKFPTIDRRAPSNVPIQPSLAHSVHNNFSPATQMGPPSGFLQNVDTESVLRNQTTALQHGATQNVYVPSSTSDLYNVHVTSTPGPQPHPSLFDRPTFAPTTRELRTQHAPIGKDQFHNHTRTQLRGL